LEDNDKLIYQNRDSIANSRFRSSNPIIILIHGFIQNYTSEFPVYEKDAYLHAGYGSTTNIIAVDWGKLSGTIDFKNLTSDIASYPSYVKAASNVYIVARRIQEFLVFLKENGDSFDPAKIHIVGQSLGAHISGMVGLYFRQATNTSIGRITGTDPASPSFQNLPIDSRLDATDATFVDIVHTNQGEFGYVGTLGDADFFINGGGPIQPDCLAVQNVTDVVCSHNIAPRFYSLSISDKTIKACTLALRILCDADDEIVFGEHCPLSARGSYFLSLRID
jgi:phosphatidic acid-selective phospholipase A1